MGEGRDDIRSASTYGIAFDGWSIDVQSVLHGVDACSFAGGRFSINLWLRREREDSKSNNNKPIRRTLA